MSVELLYQEGILFKFKLWSLKTKRIIKKVMRKQYSVVSVHFRVGRYILKAKSPFRPVTQILLKKVSFLLAQKDASPPKTDLCKLLYKFQALFSWMGTLVNLNFWDC